MDGQLTEERKYWTKILKRVVAVVRRLTSRGLALRGSDELIGSYHNGNYLMAMEMIAEFDPFLHEHLRKYGNPGSGVTNYLSSTTYEEVVRLKAEMLTELIGNKVNAAKYFAIIVDSSPDISHVDQLSVILRYVQEDGRPIEVFVTFIPTTGHKAEDLYQAVTHLLDSLGIDLTNCREQSYDNASNMSGVYTGLQSRIKEASEFAEFVPCAAHSLNLVGNAAQLCCTLSENYFSFLQCVDNFFSTSTSRWGKLLENNVEKTPKNLSSTRWSRREDACQSLLRSWKTIRSTLESFSTDKSKKAGAEAAGIVRRMSTFETAFMTVFWGKILNRINAVSTKLQKEDADLGLVIDLYDSLVSYVESIREDLSTFEEAARIFLAEETTPAIAKRIRRRNRRFDESEDEEELLSDVAKSSTERAFQSVVDCLVSELGRRKQGYIRVIAKFNGLVNFRKLTAAEIRKEASILSSSYPLDISEDIVEEILHMKVYVSTGEREHLNVNNMCEWMRNCELSEIFPNIDIALRIYKTMPVSNCGSERSFSCLRRVKNYLRSSMVEQRFNDLAILTIECEMADTIPDEQVVQEFCDKELRRRI